MSRVYSSIRHAPIHFAGIYFYLNDETALAIVVDVQRHSASPYTATSLCQYDGMAAWSASDNAAFPAVA